MCHVLQCSHLRDYDNMGAFIIQLQHIHVDACVVDMSCSGQHHIVRRRMSLSDRCVTYVHVCAGTCACTHVSLCVLHNAICVWIPTLGCITL